MKTMKTNSKNSSIKISLGFLLLNIYALLSIVFFLLSLDYFLNFLHKPVSPMVWLVLGITCFFAAICTLVKLSYKQRFIWWFFLDVLLLPISLPFYFYIYKTRFLKDEKWVVNIFYFRFWLILETLSLFTVAALFLAIGSHCFLLTFQEADHQFSYLFLGILIICLGLSYTFAGYKSLDLVISKWLISNAKTKMDNNWLLIFGSPLTWPLLLIFYHKNFYLEFDVYAKK